MVVVATSSEGAIKADSLQKGGGGWLGGSIPTLRLGIRDGNMGGTLRMGGGGDAGETDEKGSGKREAAAARKKGDWSGVASVARNAVKHILGRVVGIQEERLFAFGEVLRRRNAVEKSIIPSRSVSLAAARSGGGGGMPTDEVGDPMWEAAEEGGSAVLHMPGAPKRLARTAADALAMDAGFKAVGDEGAGKEEEEEEKRETVEGLEVVRRSGKVLQKYPFGTECFPKVGRCIAPGPALSRYNASIAPHCCAPLRLV